MKTLISLLVVLFATACVNCEERLPMEDNENSLKFCYQQIQYKGEGERNMWESRRFRCFHACMMEQRGELKNGKVVLMQYVENHFKNYKSYSDERSKIHFIECAMEANELDDKCDVAHRMGSCISNNWHLIINGGI